MDEITWVLDQLVTIAAIGLFLLLVAPVVTFVIVPLVEFIEWAWNEIRAFSNE